MGNIYPCLILKSTIYHILPRVRVEKIQLSLAELLHNYLNHRLVPNVKEVLFILIKQVYYENWTFWTYSILCTDIPNTRSVLLPEIFVFNKKCLPKFHSDSIHLFEPCLCFVLLSGPDSHSSNFVDPDPHTINADSHHCFTGTVKTGRKKKSLLVPVKMWRRRELELLCK